MIPNTNDGSAAAPRLRVDINGSNIFGLPQSSSIPKGDSRAILSAVKAAGFEGVWATEDQRVISDGKYRSCKSLPYQLSTNRTNRVNILTGHAFSFRGSAFVVRSVGFRLCSNSLWQWGHASAYMKLPSLTPQ